jgi:hypothetical protein
MSYYYTPPTWQMSAILVGSLRVHITTSTVVYRLAGVWHNQMTAGMDDPVVANCDVDTATGLRLFFNSSAVVPDNLYGELAALAPADPSWAPGSLVLVP